MQRMLQEASLELLTSKRLQALFSSLIVHILVRSYTIMPTQISQDRNYTGMSLQQATRLFKES